MRPVPFILGIITLALAWGWLAPRAKDAFCLHMTMHMAVVAAAAPLLVLGIAGGRYDPVPKWPGFFAPIPISIAELIAVWGWHTPGLHHAARHSLSGLILEQTTFLVCGVLLWLAAFGGHRDGNRIGSGIAGLLLTSMHMTLLGALLGLAPRALYHHAEGFAGLTALQDQHLGGAIMLLVGGISYLAGGIALAAKLLRQRVNTSTVAAQ